MIKETILGIKVSIISMPEVIRDILSYIENNSKCKTLFCANAHAIVVASKDKYYFDALNSADILLPDGVGTVLASKIFGGGIKNRVSGPDVFWEFSEYANRRSNICYFFLGSTWDVLEKIKENMERKFPNIKVAGCYSPPFTEVFSDEENNKIIEDINSKKPDVLWVGMTAPKQEKWVNKNKDKLNAKLIGAIGAAFDYFAETKKRTPTVFRKFGLEWLPRLIMEPGRLWKRNFISSPKFLFLILRKRFSRI